ncbi:MAG: choice-of-anchor J domain-containing protein [Bacteroidetes bacterium]|nr:choice-of-anchor J domain-containing protein [Bacteroidota bacterium]
MKRIITITVAAIFFTLAVKSQTLTRVGNPNDVNTNHQEGYLLMGGGGDNMEGLQWFYSLTNVGDVVFLRYDTGTAYNDDYAAFPGLMNSITTIESITTTARANSAAVETAVRNAEAVFIVGGNQANYYTIWKGTKLHDALLYLINEKGGAVGGTSAGMAVLGGVVYTAVNGTVTSADALSNPYRNTVTLANDYLNIPILANTVTDTHYNNPDRRGRHFVFLARMNKDWGMQARGIGANEVTAVAVQSNGIARIFGSYPAFEDYAYFLTMHPGAAGPETCTSGTPLTWNRGGQAVKVYKVPGTPNGINTFDLNTWQMGSGGYWECWSANNGTMSYNTSCTPPDFGFTYYNLTIQATPTAGGNPTGGGSYTNGTKVMLKANPVFGYNFVNWTDGATVISTQANFEYTMPASNKTITANYTLIPTDPIDGPIYLSWTVCPTANTTSYRTEQYSVYISNTGTAIGDFILLHNETLLTTHTNWDFRLRTVDISSYLGDNVYIAFRHHNSTDKDRIAINDVRLYWVDGATQVNIFNENFDASGGIPAGWTLIDADGDGRNWYHASFSGDGYLLSASFQTVALFPNNWVITPGLQLGVAPSGYKLTLQANPSGFGTVSNNPSGSYFEANDVVSISAVANNGYAFVNWTKGGVPISTSATYNYTMPAENVTLVANFAEACFNPNYAQDFTGLSALPARWTQSGTPTWAVGTSTNALIAGKAPYAYADYSGTAAQAGQMVSACFDFTSYKDISISMLHRFYLAAAGVGSAFLEYSINNGAWTQIATWTATMGAGATYSSGIIPALTGASNVKFRWRVAYNSHGNPSRQKNWSVDDIAITGTFVGPTNNPGDVNNDGFINVLDVVWMVSHLNGSTPVGFNIANADVNGDTNVNIADLTALINLILGGAKDSSATASENEASIFLNKDGLVTFESDGSLIAMQFQLNSAQVCNANITLMLNTDHHISFNNDTGMGVIYSMNNTAIPAGKIDLFKIFDVAIATIKWGLTEASSEIHTLVPIKSGSVFDTTPVTEILSKFDVNVYPNPTAGKYSVRLVLPEDAYVEFMLITRSGGIIRQTESTLFGQGEHILEFTADSSFRSGMYFISISISDSKTRKLMRKVDEKIIIMR